MSENPLANRPPLLKRPAEPSVSPTLLPNDQLRMLVELLKTGSLELTRRWVAALLLVPEAEREAVVKSVEGRIVAVYDNPTNDALDDREIVVRYPAVQHDGYVEEVVKRYEVKKAKGSAGGVQHENRQRRSNGR